MDIYLSLQVDLSVDKAWQPILTISATTTWLARFIGLPPQASRISGARHDCEQFCSQGWAILLTAVSSFAHGCDALHKPEYDGRKSIEGLDEKSYLFGQMAGTDAPLWRIEVIGTIAYILHKANGDKAVGQ